MLRPTKTLLVVAALLAGAVAAGTGVAQTPSATAAATQSATVSMVNNRFVPSEIVVSAGTTVTWVNEDYESGEWHDVIAENGAFFLDVFGPGDAYSVTLYEPGIYVYYCDLHADMFGSVTVE